MFDNLIKQLAEYGFNESEAKNIIRCVRSDSADQLKIDAEKWISYVFDICEKEQLIRLVAMGFTNVSYINGEMHLSLDADFRESPSAFLDRNKNT